MMCSMHHWFSLSSADVALELPTSGSSFEENRPITVGGDSPLGIQKGLRIGGGCVSRCGSRSHLEF